MVEETDFVLYSYDPSLGGAIAFIILFILASIVHAGQTWYASRIASYELNNPFVAEESPIDSGKKNKMYSIKSLIVTFIPFYIGCGMEIIGYIARARSSSNVELVTPYVIQSVLLLVSPAFFAATIYMVFGRLLYYMDSQSLMFISPRFGTTFFVAGDVLSFFLQSAGGGIMTKSSGRNTGPKVIIAGLIIQIIFFGFFIIMETRFTLKVKKICPYYEELSKKWLLLNLSLLLASLLIMIRSIVRVVESIQGYDGYIRNHEYFLFVFDALPMFFVVIVFCFAAYYGSIFAVMIECRASKLMLHRESSSELKNDEDV